MMNNVETADQRRKWEAMNSLVDEIAHGDDDKVTVSIRSALERGWNFSFSECLIEARKKKEVEIDKICARHYNDFLKSVQDLVQLQNSAKLILKPIHKLNTEFQATSQDLQIVLNELEKRQQEKENIKKCLRTIQNCQYISNIMISIQHSMDENNFYQAMHHIQKLQQLLKTDIIPIESISKKVELFLKEQYEHLLFATKNELQDMFSFLRTERIPLGKAIIHRFVYLTSNNFKNNISTVNNNTTTTLTISIQYILNNFTILESYDYYKFLELLPSFYHCLPKNNNEAEEDNILINIPTTLPPLLKAIFIYNQLDMLPTFHNIYKGMRESMMSISLLHPSLTILQLIQEKGFEMVLEDIIYHIIGFFSWECISRRLIDCSEALLSYGEITLLWDKVCLELQDIFTLYSSTKITSTFSLLRIKEMLVILAECIIDEAIQLRPNILFDILSELWNKFEGLEQLQLRSFLDGIIINLNIKSFTTINDSAIMDTCEQISNCYQQKNELLNNNGHINTEKKLKINEKTIDDLEESFSILLTSPTSDDNYQNSIQSNTTHTVRNDTNNNHENTIQHFTIKKIPFSIILPKTILYFRQMIIRMIIISVKNPRLSDRSKNICLLTKQMVEKIYENYMSLLYPKDIAASQLQFTCQVCIDMNYFLSSLNTLQNLCIHVFRELQWSDSLDVLLPKCFHESQVMIENLIQTSQDLIFEQLQSNIENLLHSLQLIKWESPESIIPKSPHMQIDGLIDYLRIAFSYIQEFPTTIKEAIHFIIMTKINRDILDYLYSKKVIKINILTLLQLELDCQALVQFATQCGVNQLNQCFIELTEVIKVLLLSDFNILLDSKIATERFPYVDIYKVSFLIEKLINAPVAVSATLPKHDKKVIASVIKKIRQKK